MARPRGEENIPSTRPASKGQYSRHAGESAGLIGSTEAVTQQTAYAYSDASTR